MSRRVQTGKTFLILGFVLTWLGVACLIFYLIVVPSEEREMKPLRLISTLVFLVGMMVLFGVLLIREFRKGRGSGTDQKSKLEGAVPMLLGITVEDAQKPVPQWISVVVMTVALLLAVPFLLALIAMLIKSMAAA